MLTGRLTRACVIASLPHHGPRPRSAKSNERAAGEEILARILDQRILSPPQAFSDRPAAGEENFERHFGRLQKILQDQHIFERIVRRASAAPKAPEAVQGFALLDRG